MCTVTFLPEGKEHFILTHNRDEHYTRGIALMPALKKFHGHTVIAPTDPNAGGTWIAVSAHAALCLLNGGFARHERTLPYRQSRGWVIPDFFGFKDPLHFIEQYPAEGIEPFTLVIVQKDPLKVFEVVWDGNRLHHQEKDPHQPYIWSSTTLYSDEDRERRAAYFERFTLQKGYSRERANGFHTNRFEQYTDEGIQINRGNVLQTVSLSSILVEEKTSFYYEDLLQNKQSYIEL